jgi:glycosyltransferase involved in cell wall biosynthesis
VRVLVVTCAHRGDDARIVHRQARSLLEHGHDVTLVAPLPETTGADPQGLERVPVRRASGRSRLSAWRDVRRAVSSQIDQCDLVLLHDPELVLLSRPWRRRPVVWDVHEDFAASVSDRTWIPRGVRSLVAAAVGLLQRWAAARLHIVIAEDSYAASFPHAPVVPNSTWMPEPVPIIQTGQPCLVYVGRVSRARGALEMIEVGHRLRDEMTVVVIGSADADVVDLVQAAHADGVIDARGPLPNPEALDVASGALAGLSLLHDIANYRHSRPTKIAEYLANGVPVITTPLPLAREMIETSGAGIVVPHGGVSDVADAVVEAARRLAADPTLREAMVAAGRTFVTENHSWNVDGDRFVALLESWAL